MKGRAHRTRTNSTSASKEWTSCMKPVLNWARSLVWGWQQNEEVKAKTTDAYQTYSSPNTAHSCSFSSAHLATWEGGEEEDGGGRKVDNVTAWKNQHWWKNTLLFLYQLLIHHLWLVCPFLTVYSTTKSTLNIVASSFHRIKQSKSQRYFPEMWFAIPWCANTHIWDTRSKKPLAFLLVHSEVNLLWKLYLQYLILLKFTFLFFIVHKLLLFQSINGL